MAKKKGVAAFRSKRRNPKRRKPGVPPPGVPWQTRKKNPPLWTDAWKFVLPGLGGYAATRFMSRIAYGQIRKRWPRAGKHAGVIASLGSFLAAWYLVHRFKRLAPYHTPIVVGSGIAALQTVVQAYIPKYGWIVSDFEDSGRNLAATAPAPQLMTQAQAAQSAPVQSAFPASGWDMADYESQTSADDSVEEEVIADDDLAGVLDDDETVDDLYTGSFAD
jgi:hypothetical protein